MKYGVVIITIVVVFCTISPTLVSQSTHTDTAHLKVNKSADYLVINEVYYCWKNQTSGELWTYGTWWIEIYNPTNRLFNLTALTYLNLDCVTVLPRENRTVEFKPHEFILFCGSVENLTAVWDIPNGTKIIELSFYGHNVSMTITSDDEKSEEGSGKCHDYIGTGGEYYPLPPLNHSWARYKGGYDTDNFTNDFYDEPNPTPGYGNNRAKDSDDDGISDAWEIYYGLNPNDANDSFEDWDDDGLSNLAEYENGTNPLMVDSDGDGFSDLVEIRAGTDPMDMGSHPQSNHEKEVWKEFLAGIIAVIIILTLLLFYVIYRRKGREKRVQKLYGKDREDK